MPRPLTIGTRLVRDWHEVGHTVIVRDDGFEYDGKHWKSAGTERLSPTRKLIRPLNPAELRHYSGAGRPEAKISVCF